ncbi:hypothetical protein Fot_24286 [Forsythia ovata]|uniref:Secreted protein n=1 Tax=Forsythia ovata TaxID=205694 RepID=A0ABD1U5T1_9LAMI
MVYLKHCARQLGFRLLILVPVSALAAFLNKLSSLLCAACYFLRFHKLRTLRQTKRLSIVYFRDDLSLFGSKSAFFLPFIPCCLIGTFYQCSRVHGYFQTKTQFNELDLKVTVKILFPS